MMKQSEILLAGKMFTKIVFSIVISLVVSTNIYAGESEDFYYDRGYENGYQKGLLKGQQEAFKDAKLILKAYKDRVKAYEIGKYLVESKHLTAPQVYQELEDGSMKIVVVPSKIEKEFNIDDIFDEFGSLPTLSKNKDKEENKDKDPNELNSIYLSQKDGTYNDMFDKANRDTEKTTLTVDKSSSNRDILNSANVAYVENKDSYEVVFFTKQEKKDFCSEFKKLCK